MADIRLKSLIGGLFSRSLMGGALGKKSTTITPPSSGFFLVQQDGVSKALQQDGTSKIKI